MTVFKTLGINLGYKCNFKCSHCLDSSDIKQIHSDLCESDFKAIKIALNTHQPEELYFVGGETTLYIPAIVKIISDYNKTNPLKVAIRTNGWFLNSTKEAQETLKLIPNLNEVQLSADQFHNEELNISLKRAEILDSYCKANGLICSVTCAVSNDFDRLKFLSKFSNLTIKTNFIRVLPVGRAKDMNVQYEYNTFNQNVLKEKCPNAGRAIYFSKRGFTSCCSTLSASGAKGYNFIYENILTNLESNRFFIAAKNLNISEMASSFGININSEELKPEHSNICTLCESIFKTIQSDSP
jgi:MoaA/NifB/PqqE/SkfB family radical SAM enzyme